MHRGLRVVPFAFTAFVVPLVACDDDATSDATDVPEAGAPLADAGGGDGQGPDGSAPKTGVSVTVKKAGAPLGDVRVVFGGQDGSLAGETTTDAAGLATTDGTARYVTVVLAPDGEAVSGLITYTDVADGDELLVDIPAKPVAGPPTALGTFSITWASVTGASSYEAYVGNCSGDDPGGQPFTFPVYSYCTNQGRAPLLGIVRGGSGGDLGQYGLMYAPRPDVLAPTGGATVPQPTFGVSELQAPMKVVVKLISAPGGVNVASNVDVLNHGVIFPPGLRSGNSGGQEEFLVAPFAETLVGNVAFDGEPDGINHVRHMYRRIDRPGGPGEVWTGDITFDFNYGDSIQSIKTATVTESAPGRPELAFSTDPGFAAPEVALAQVVWFGGAKGGVWWFVANPKDNGWKAPALPDDLAPPGGSTWALPAFALATSTLYEGYGEAKRTPVDHAMSRFLYDRALTTVGSTAFTLNGEFYAPQN